MHKELYKNYYHGMKKIFGNYFLTSWGDYEIIFLRYKRSDVSMDEFNKLIRYQEMYDCDFVAHDWYDILNKIYVNVEIKMPKWIDKKNKKNKKKKLESQRDSTNRIMNKFIQFNQLSNIRNFNEGNNNTTTTETKNYYYIFQVLTS